MVILATQITILMVNMSRSMDLLKKRIQHIPQERGRKAEIRRVTGFSQSQLDGYIAGTAVPGLDQLDRLAAALGVEPWTLIQPGLSHARVEAISRVCAMDEDQLAGLLGLLKNWPGAKKRAEPAKGTG